MQPHPRTATLDVPGARIAYDVHGEAGEHGDPVPLLLLGAPMDASGFTTLASLLGERLVVTHDPRNAGRSERDEPTAAVDVATHADDLHALVLALGGGPVDVFASSGGATNTLALVARHPDDVRTLVAHEPPLACLLPDADAIRAVCADLVRAYDAQGRGPAMARFIALVAQRGPVPDDLVGAPGPDPAVYGLPVEDDGTRDDALMSNMRGGLVSFVPDLDAVRAAPTRVVVGVGEDSGGPDDGEMAGRGAWATAAALGQQAVVFPGGHGGFVGGEHGRVGRPEEFADRLREVLAAG